VQPVSHVPCCLDFSHLLSCFLGLHALFLLSELWALAMVLAPFVSYRRKKLWSLTAREKKSSKWENYRAGLPDVGGVGRIDGTRPQGREKNLGVGAKYSACRCYGLSSSEGRTIPTASSMLSLL